MQERQMDSYSAGTLTHCLCFFNPLTPNWQLGGGLTYPRRANIIMPDNNQTPKSKNKRKIFSFLKSSLVSLSAISSVWLGSSLFELPVKDLVPWFQVAGFSAMAANNGLQVAERLEDKDKN